MVGKVFKPCTADRRRCLPVSATWRKPIGDRVADPSQTVADHMETRLKLSWKHLEALHY